MKERIVIDEDFYVKHFQEREKDFYEEDLCSGGNPEEWWHYKVEQVPESWEDLKKLCRGFKGAKFFYDKVAGVEYININDIIAFNENGLMLAMKNNFDVLAKKRTLAQMWNIIKSLIGEE